MFKYLIDKIRQAKQAAKLKERQQRFTDIINDKRSDTLAPIFRRLAQNDLTVTDEQILSAYYYFSDRIQTNTFAAAELEWVTKRAFRHRKRWFSRSWKMWLNRIKRT